MSPKPSRSEACDESLGSVDFLTAWHYLNGLSVASGITILLETSFHNTIARKLFASREGGVGQLCQQIHPIRGIQREMSAFIKHLAPQVFQGDRLKLGIQ